MVMETERDVSRPGGPGFKESSMVGGSTVNRQFQCIGSFNPYGLSTYYALRDSAKTCRQTIEQNQGQCLSSFSLQMKAGSAFQRS